ncbi:MAG: hypothetical protein ACSHYA_13785 [Opitutaceae bacterium]
MMRFPLLTTLSLLCFISTIGNAGPSNHEPKESYIDSELPLEFYPVKRATVIRLLGLFTNPLYVSRHTGPVDPFAADPPQTGYLAANPKPLSYYLSILGFNFHDNQDGASFAFDGDQLIVRAKAKDHKMLTELLNKTKEPEQVRISYWLEHEQTDITGQVTDITEYPAASLQIQSGKRTTLQYEAGIFSISTTPSIQSNGETTLISEITLRTKDGVQISLSSEHSLPNSIETEIAALTFETDDKDKNQNQQTSYRIFSKAELIGPDGEIRPFNDSLIKRLNLSNICQHEVARFHLSKASGIKLAGLGFMEDANAAMKKFLLSDHNIQFSSKEKTGFNYVPKSEEFVVRHTPETLHTIRKLIDKHSPDQTTQSTWALKHDLEVSDRTKSQKLSLTTRSLSGKKVTFRYTKEEGDTTSELNFQATTNIENHGDITTIQNVSLTGFTAFPDIKNSNEAVVKSDVENETFSLMRSLSKTGSKESFTETLTVSAPMYQPLGTDLITRLYPIYQGAVIRLAGFRNCQKTHGSTDPFAKREPSSISSTNDETSVIICFFECNGISFSETSGAQLAFDGEQLIITQTEEAHLRIQKVLRAPYHQPQMSRLNIEVLVPNNTLVGSFSSLCRSGKSNKYRLDWNDTTSQHFDFKLATNHRNNDTTEAIVEMDASVFHSIPHVKFSTGASAANQKTAELVSVQTTNDDSAKLMMTITTESSSLSPSK